MIGINWSAEGYSGELQVNLALRDVFDVYDNV